MPPRSPLRGEEIVDVPRTLHALESGKLRIARAIRRQVQRQVREVEAGKRKKLALFATKGMVQPLYGLRDFGRAEARRELKRLGMKPGPRRYRAEDLPSGRVVHAATQTVALRLEADLTKIQLRTQSTLDDVQAAVTAELRMAVSEVNGLAKGIAAANQKVAALRGLGQPPNDVLDERDRLISRLSELVKISRVEATDGTLQRVEQQLDVCLGSFNRAADPSESRLAPSMASLHSLLNARIDQRLLFAGTAIGEVAFDDQGFYRGNDLPVLHQLSDDIVRHFIRIVDARDADEGVVEFQRAAHDGAQAGPVGGDQSLRAVVQRRGPGTARRRRRRRVGARHHAG